MIEKLLEFTKKAGEIAVRNQLRINEQDNALKQKEVHSVVTETDIEISDLFSAFVEDNFSDLNYMVIDEEKIAQYGDKIFDRIDETEYQFVIDPIDGTMIYANMQPMFGTIIGVFKNKKPLLGIVYMPKLKDLIYFDGNKAFWAQNAFEQDEIKKELLPGKKSRSAILYASNCFFDLTEDYSEEKMIMLDYFSACSQIIYVLTGRGRGLGGQSSLWDIGGGVAIAEHLGMKFIDVVSGRYMDKISPEIFDHKMGMKNPGMLCYPEEFNEIIRLVRLREVKA